MQPDSHDLPQLDSNKRPERVLLHFHPLSTDDPGSPPAIPPVELRIGYTTSEDILCELGAAVRTFWKEDVRSPPVDHGMIPAIDLLTRDRTVSRFTLPHSRAPPPPPR